MRAAAVKEVKMAKEERGPRVYVTEIPMQRDPQTNELIPRRHVDAAYKYGDVTVLQPDRGAERPFDMEPIVEELKEKLSDFQPQDYFMAGLGHPLILAAATAIVAQKVGGTVNFLHWYKGVYLPTTVKLF